MTEKLKEYLNRNISELESVLQKQKRNYRILFFVYYTIVSFSILASQITIFLTMEGEKSKVMDYVVAVLNFIACFCTAISTRFDISYRRETLKEKMGALSTLKEKLNYVVQCNGDLSEDDKTKMMEDIRKFAVSKYIL